LASVLLAEIEKQGRNDAPIVAETKERADKLLAAAHKVAASHSGSNFGYHGALYYRDFEVPSLRSMFNVEWGGIHGIPSGWTKREPDEVKLRIEAIALLSFASTQEAIKNPLDSAKRMLREISIQLAPLHQLPDGNREKELLQALEKFDWKDSVQQDYSVSALKCYPNMTRDSGAFSQGVMFASHDYYAAVATQVKKSCESIEEFWALSERLLRQLQMAGSSKLLTQHDPVDTTTLSVKYERLRLWALLLAALVLSVIIAAAAEFTIRRWHWEWLLSHPNSYSIRCFTYLVLLLFLVGLFVRKFRNYCWVFALLPLLVGVIQVLGGPAARSH
jgi:hypothetical protein